MKTNQCGTFIISGLDLDHTDEGEENDVDDDELDHEEAEDLLADETIEPKTDTIAPATVSGKLKFK